MAHISDLVRDVFCETIKADECKVMFSFFTDCLYGTYGIECRKACNCKGGICDRETGACLTLRFFAKIAGKLKTEPQEGTTRTFKIAYSVICEICEIAQLCELEAGLVRSWKTWKSHGILKWSLPGLEKSWKKLKS